jgi:lysozyme
MRVSSRGVDLVATFEGFRRDVYLDAARVKTIGFGETSPAIIARYESTGIPRRVAFDLLKARLDRDYAPAVRSINRYLVLRGHLPLPQESFDALTSFVYNVGPGAIGVATGVGRELRARRWESAMNHLMLWNRAGGQELLGLTRRRQAERDLFLAGIRRRRARIARRRAQLRLRR